MKVANPRVNWHERIYLWEICRGMVVTIRHLLGNLFRQRQMPTVQWPEEVKPLPPRTRGRHRLMVREDGTPKCVACFMCATVCPARCIHIEAEESDEPTIEKRPKVFEIDLLHCVFCGCCVEACPEDAIRMDTGEITFVADNREDFVLHLDFLLHGKGEEWKTDRETMDQVAGERRKPVFPPPDAPQEMRVGHRRHRRPPVPSSW